MITALAWVRRGVAREQPRRYKLDQAEYDRIRSVDAQRNTYSDAEDEDQDQTKGAAAAVTGDAADPELAEYDLDNYDTEDDSDGAMASGKPNRIKVGSKVKGLMYLDDSELLQSQENGNGGKDDDDNGNDSEAEEIQVLPTDNFLVAAKTADEFDQLEVYVYEEDEDHIYVHHDIHIPALALCLEWLDYTPKSSTEGSAAKPGNYMAVGTYDPAIEIWDLDVIDAMYPAVVLGRTATTPGKKRADTHTDVILSLSWNRHHRNLLASASGDTTVKLWDLQTARCVTSYHHHTDKVQAVEWNPVENTVLATGGYDKRVAVLDSRAPKQVHGGRLNADVECLRWDPHNPYCFYVSSEDGLVQYVDARQWTANPSAATSSGWDAPLTPIYTLHAHDAAVSAFDVNPAIPGCIVTGSTDAKLKLWNIDESNKPSLVVSRDMDTGELFSLAFCPDAPFKIAAAGSNARVKVWDAYANAGVRQAFADRAKAVVASLGNAAPTTDDKDPIELEDADEEPEDDDEDGEEAGEPYKPAGSDNDENGMDMD